MSDAGPLIHLSWIGRLDILFELFGEILVPTAVRDEVLRSDPTEPSVQAISAAFGSRRVIARSVVDRASVHALAGVLDPGEAEAIALAQEIGCDVFLVDDRRARREAEHRGLTAMGTIGLLRLARERAVVTNIRPLLDELLSRGFWIGSEIVTQILGDEASIDET